MKKLVALLVALMMLGCMSAMAETTDMAEYDLSGVEAVDFGATNSISNFQNNSFAQSGADRAVITNDLCTIYSDNMVIKFDVAQGAFVYFTQDFMASYMEYVLYTNDPQAANATLIENAIHLQILDQMYNDFYNLQTLYTINMKGALGTLSMLPENVQIQLGKQLAVELGGVYGGIVKYNNTSWVKVADECYITLVDGNVILFNGAHINNGNYVALTPGSSEMMLMTFDITLAE